LQPSQALFPDAGYGWSDRCLNPGKNIRELRMACCKLRETFRGPEHLVGIPADSGPTEQADLIDDVRRVSATGSQITAVNYEVRRDLPQVSENRLEGAAIAVNIR
jgi:hypothetical protein